MKKDLIYYLDLDYPFTITKDKEEGKTYFIAEIPDLPGCGAHGKSIAEAINKLEKAKSLWIEASLERGLDIPEPVSEEEFSGKFLLRIPPKLHMRLTRQSKKEGLSLNQYLRKTLEGSITVGNILERLETIEREVKQIREKIEKPEVAYVETWEDPVVWGLGYGSSAIESGGAVLCIDTSQYKNISGGIHEIK